MNLNTTAAKISAPDITFSPDLQREAKEVYVIGRKACLTQQSGVSVTSAENDEKIIGALLNSIKESGKATTFLTDERKLTVIALPAEDKISRNNHTFSPHEITDSLDGLHSSARENLVQICVIDQEIEKFMCPVAAAIARAMPLYHSKSSLKELAPTSGVNVTFYSDNAGEVPTHPSAEKEYETASAVCNGVRLAAQLGDMPPAELSPDTYAQKCQEIANGFAAQGVTYTEIKGDDLRQKGYGGIMGVGMAARCPPRMVIMTYSPANATEHIALCGKGVVYDTGGLALKSKVGECVCLKLI